MVDLNTATRGMFKINSRRSFTTYNSSAVVLISVNAVFNVDRCYIGKLPIVTCKNDTLRKTSWDRTYRCVFIIACWFIFTLRLILPRFLPVLVQKIHFTSHLRGAIRVRSFSIRVRIRAYGVILCFKCAVPVSSSHYNRNTRFIRPMARLMMQSLMCVQPVVKLQSRHWTLWLSNRQRKAYSELWILIKTLIIISSHTRNTRNKHSH